VGILSTAVKRGLADPADARRAADLMAALNRTASEAMLETGANACTDITGFGLLGHLHEMTAGSRVDVTVHAAAVPVLSAAAEFAGADVVPGGTLDNLAHVQPHVAFAPGIDRVTRLILADAQTSGGLLISLPEDRAGKLLTTLRERGVGEAALIGRVTGVGDGNITVEE
jgi:selenide,water dikinase